jgi:transposase
MRPADIAIYAGISQASVERILRYFSLHGSIDHGADRKKRKKYLRDMDIEVSAHFFLSLLCSFISQFLFGTIRHTPDLYIDELQEMLAVNCGQDVSRSTIWRMLRRGGFTLKKVSDFMLSNLGI